MKLGIFILSGDSKTMLFRCLQSIKLTIESPYKIYLAYNGKSILVESEIRSFISETFAASQIKLVNYSFYNFAALNNDLFNNHLDPDVDLLLFCNNDVILRGHCVDSMAKAAWANSGVFGTIGCRLLYENNTIQHDGQVVFIKDGCCQNVSHLHQGELPENHTFSAPQRVIGNSFALCVTQTVHYKAIGGLNENYNVCFEDLEYNLRCLQLGLVNILLPSPIWSYHTEGASRNKAGSEINSTTEDSETLVNFINQKYLGGQDLLVRLN